MAPNQEGAIKAFHGSPHDFDKFSTSQIGTGEGAQAYGHGLYFAESEDVARGYRDDLTAPRVQRAQSAIDKYNGDVDAAIDASKKEIDRLQTLDLTPDTGAAKRDSLISAQEEKLSELAAFKNDGQMNKGSMYQVEIDADPEDFLDWDKLLDEQPDIMKKVGDTDWGEYAAEGVDDMAAMHGQNPGGDTLHKWLAEDGADFAAEQLNNSGIKGIKYKDGFSRGTDAGTSNFVVFNEDLITISKKYGIAIPAAAALLSEQIFKWGTFVETKLND